MAFVDSLREKIAKKRKGDVLDDVKTNPEFAVILNKLEELVVKRDVISNELSKVELEIDACLVFIELKQQKLELDKKS